MFGWFQSMLTDLPGPPLHETIPGFHDTPRRLRYFQQVLAEDKCNRAKGAAAEIDFVVENAAICNVLPDLVARGEVAHPHRPQRHEDQQRHAGQETPAKASA